ncbi:conserved hypothetical protein [Candidatus Accumulibacter aalborgensis]|uniref:Uncharacterized protein n=1 Tax=Candidatus Accumulibacter aalborgensis TaxID=1860102 RepID=A0A1A8XXV4_9PROT|nr:hypothetical protein [Candidatus Accumulibacter aalborgensis]SBT08883.1 conserved hypothetical protein [Candidatus Accumulibacter aalborgensis]
MNYPKTLSIAHGHDGQHDASGSVILAAWQALQLLFAGLCEPAQTAGKNPGAYPATFINLP